MSRGVKVCVKMEGHNGSMGRWRGIMPALVWEDEGSFLEQGVCVEKIAALCKDDSLWQCVENGSLP